jgi:hypothetical protein
MSRARPKSSPTDAYARRIAHAVVRGRPPPFSASLDRYCESSPHEIFAAFSGIARHMPPAGQDKPLAIGYLFLLQRLLEHLRYRVDRGYADEAGLIEELQAEVVAQVEAGQVDANMLAFVGGALHQSGIPVSPELVAASARHLADPEPPNSPLPADVHAALAGILKVCEGDPFLAVGSLMESGHTMPAEARGALAGALALSGGPEARGAAVLFLLDPDSAVRRAVAGALAQVASSMTPTEVRRLIAMRNWRPEHERAEVDVIIRGARAAGIDCAPWQAGSAEAIVATAIDGVSAQGFLLISPVGRKKRLSSILIKGRIADAWSGEPETRRRIEISLDAAGDAPQLAVSRSYLDRIVAHQLALGIEQGQAPPFGLLQVAETIGGAGWQPARMDFGETLAGLMAEIPSAMCEPAALASVLRRSDELADLEVVAQSWFEDDPQVAQAVERAGDGLDRAKLAACLLQGVMKSRRDRWADIFLRTALWMHAAAEARDLCWRELAIVAKALADGRDMTEIGLMHDIALRTIAVRTIAVLAGAGRT